MSVEAQHVTRDDELREIESTAYSRSESRTSMYAFMAIPRLCCVLVLVQGAGDTDIHMVRVVSDPQWRGLRRSSLEGEPDFVLRRGQPQPHRHPRDRPRMVRVQGLLPQQAAQHLQERYLVSPGRPR